MRVLKIQTLPCTKDALWVDRDCVMLHACFELLVGWVEREGGLTHANYETYREIIDELTALYCWWKNGRDEEDLSNIIENEKEDQSNLELLISHREFLWT